MSDEIDVIVIAFSLPLWTLATSIGAALWSLFILVWAVRKTRKGKDDVSLYGMAIFFAVVSLGLFLFGVSKDDTDIPSTLETTEAVDVG